MRWIAPESEAELTEWLRATGIGGARARLPTGGGARSADDTGGSDPRKTSTLAVPGVQVGGVPGIDVISLEAPEFARILEYEPKDLTITIGAGARLDRLQETLGAEGQWLPPGALGALRSVGGLVGAAPPGPFDAAFGSVRRHVLAVRTLAWDGRSLTWGRAVVKNVAGYDMSGLWCGSRGRLGVVTQTSLRVWPQPEHREWIEVHGSADGWSLLESLGGMAPEDDFRADAVLWRGGRPGQGARALLGFLGSEAAVRSRGALARTWAASHGYEVRVGDAPERHSRSGSFAEVIMRVHCPRTRVSDVGRRLTRALGDTPAILDALPELGTLTLSYTRPDHEARAAALRAALFQAADGARITLQRGAPEELAATEARREADVRRLEETVLGALGGTARHWLADHV